MSDEENRREAEQFGVKPRKLHVHTKAPGNKTKKQKISRMRQLSEKEFPIPSWIIQIVGSILVTLIVESLCRRSVAGAFEFVHKNPMAFLLNCSLVALAIAIALMFKRRLFAIVLAESIWVILAAVNYGVMSRRGRLALYPADLHGITEGIVVMPKLFEWWQIALISAIVMLVIAGLVVLLLRTQKYRRDITKSWLRLVSTALVFTLSLLLCLENGYISRSLRPDFYASYKKNGFAYSFLFGVFDTGMNEPTGYTDQAVKDILDTTIVTETNQTSKEETKTEDGTNAKRLGIITENTSLEGYDAETIEGIETRGREISADADYPNIILLQLEAFCEPDKINEYAYEGEPIPTFMHMKQSCTSGTLGVPTVAGGTCNTEFEVLTGCDLDLFGANEYPYYDLVKNNEFESLAHDLKPYGYNSTFLHNYSGTFYNRNEVYSNFGFDRFASLEYMNDYEETDKGWAKDEVLGTYIMKSLESTEGKDFVMAVGVQTHSAYPELSDEEAPFLVTQSPDGNESYRLQFQYYLEQMNSVDAFLADLTEKLASYDEKVLLVVYGDHLPGLSFNHDQMTTEELFSTSYVIWANYELEKQDRDLEAYQLGAYALKLADIKDAGTMITIHQKYMDSYDYMDKLKLVQYDITYGEHYLYLDSPIMREEPMQFGVEPIEIERLFSDRAGNLQVYGKGFTQDAVIYLGGRSQDTIFVNESLLIAPNLSMSEDDVLDIRFFGADGGLLSVHGIAEEEPA
ncbi:MAG: sulfatase-like hydrolase/transferase [Clostridia bacterium]|nr:sulfatase-like hydrolase/transferase [Clostridia bacterium]